MLIAEVHGRYIPEALTSEDYLTSAVFGHLRYVAPGVFWQELLSAAVSLPTAGHESNAAATIADLTGRPVAQYDTLDIVFWPCHPQGEPDLLLVFRAAGYRPFALFVEVKLDSSRFTTRSTAEIALEKNVKPVYAWFNGFTREQLLAEPVQKMADGSVGMMVVLRRNVIRRERSILSRPSVNSEPAFETAFLWIACTCP